MTPRFQTLIIAATAFLVAVSAFGQSNVYSLNFYAGGVTYYPSRWAVGSHPFRFGLEEYSYSTDAAGYTIMFSPGRGVQPGDTYHRRTQILLGPISFSVPLRPISVVIIGGVVVLLFGFFTTKFRLRAFTFRRDEIVA
jgi:hypothetical protein